MVEPDIHDSREELWAAFEKRKSKGRIWVGFLLLIAGGLLFLKTLNLLIVPGWFLTWPVFLIALGLISGIMDRFKGGFWIVAIFVGSAFLANEIDPTLHIDRFIAPIIVFSLGLLFLFKPRHRRWRQFSRWERRSSRYPPIPVRSEPEEPTAGPSEQAYYSDRRDFIDITAVFGGVKKNVLTKTFKGGDITSFMGGSEINLSQADFSGEVKIDITNVFGGTKLIIPPSWTVHSEIITIFGGMDDKRQFNGLTQDNGKTLILEGTCLFGGIEITSY